MIDAEGVLDIGRLKSVTGWRANKHHGANIALRRDIKRYLLSISVGHYIDDSKKPINRRRFQMRFHDYFIPRKCNFGGYRLRRIEALRRGRVASPRAAVGIHRLSHPSRYAYARGRFRQRHNIEIIGSERSMPSVELHGRSRIASRHSALILPTMPMALPDTDVDTAIYMTRKGGVMSMAASS